MRHDGAVIWPSEQPAGRLPVVWVHGFGSHFADRRMKETTALAERMVAEGRGDELLPYGMLGPGFTTRTAAAYLDYLRALPDVFGAASADPPIAQVRCPVLAFFGTQEPERGAAADLDLIRRNARAARVDTRLVEGDHGYTGHEEAAADVIADWMATIR
ncbi:MAG TPA: hypothetical protein VG370_20210 [Chloroflexota bacterium]|nr:hypothetical protein [Chloroflexota bacterium]